jgi:hypothetical protein
MALLCPVRRKWDVAAQSPNGRAYLCCVLVMHQAAELSNGPIKLPPHTFSTILTARAVNGKLSRLALASSPGVLTVDLSRIYAAPITRLGCLAFEGQGAFAPQS